MYLKRFNITIKTTDEVHNFILKWIRSYPDDIEITSNNELIDTSKMYSKDVNFRNLEKQKKAITELIETYRNKNNHKYLENE